MKHILIIDDDSDRHAWVKELYPLGNVTSAFAFHDVIARLEIAASFEMVWDILHLDHDLADSLYAPRSTTLWRTPDPRPVDPTIVVCPYCNAKVSEQCTSARSRSVITESGPHKDRVALATKRLSETIGLYYTGLDVVDWLVANPTKCPKHVYIHSWADEAVEMERRLRECSALAHIEITRQQAPI